MNPRVRLGVAGNRSIPDDALRSLSQDPNAGVASRAQAALSIT